MRLDRQDSVALLDCDLVLAGARQLGGDNDFAAFVEHVDQRLAHLVDDESFLGGVDVAERLDAAGARAPPAGAGAGTLDRAPPLPPPPRRSPLLVLPAPCAP